MTAPDPRAALERLTALHPRLIDLSLDRVWRLLAALGNPQQRLPPVIHVAGTNGKGSTVAFLRALLEAGGQRVHVYTSPHLVRFNERIRLASGIISDEALVDLLHRTEQANAGHEITFFEATTVAALLAFSEQPADVVILETGLGGRLDATNVVTRPLVTVLTPIGMDHEQFLGSSLAAIAGEKAHILKAGVPAVSAAQPPEAAAVIAARAQEVQAPLWREGEDFSWSLSGGQYFWNCPSAVSPVPASPALPPPALAGQHQGQNAALALAALAAAGFVLPPSQQAAGLQSVQWPARMQQLTRGPLADSLPPGWELWLDGAHNPHAAAMLAQFLPSWQDQPLEMITGMMGPKDAGGFFRLVAPFVRRLRAVPVEGEMAGKPPEEVVAAAQAAGIADACVCSSALQALESLRGGLVEPRGRVLVCGSLYLAGSLLAENS